MTEENGLIVSQSDATGTGNTGNYEVGSDHTDVGSESFSTTQGSGGEGVVNYYFPVEVVVAGGLTLQDRKSIQASIFEEFNDAINRRMA
jgi:hypothetical protein